MSPGETIKQMRVKRMKVAAVSIVPKGAATGSDGYMIQATPELVSPADRPVLVQHVARQIGALDGDERKAAIDQFLAVLEQGAVAEELAEIRAGWPDYELWDAFCSAYYDAKNDEGKRTAIADFGAVLTRELIPADGTVQQGETMPEKNTTPDPTQQGSPETAPLAGGQEETPLTQESVQAMITAALAPVTESLTQATSRAETAEAALEQQKTENARLQSKLTPASKQPDADPTPVVAQADKPENPYANSGVDVWLKQHFPG